MLDDLKMIHTRDASDALGIAGKQAGQYLNQYGFSWKPSGDIENVVVAGMGGSGLAAKAFKNYPTLSVPFEVVQSYDLPSYVNEKTLLIVSSYSGNTEETISAFKQALDKNPRPNIVVVTAGGDMERIAQDNSLPLVKLPGGFQPRMTFGYQYRALCEIFESVGLASGVISDLDESTKWLEQELASWRPDIKTENNLAKQMALDIVGKSVVMYASSKFFPVAYKWKISFNENAKNVAWCNEYSEFNHNEFIGWTSHPVDKPYAVIELVSSFDNSQIKKRFDISRKLLSGKRPASKVIDLKGDTVLKQMLWGVSLGDFVSLYVALLNGLDPTPVDLIEKLKKELA
jgi:glucose/mannose-6-phosphate isomerase